MTFKRLVIPIANDEQTLAQDAIRSGFVLARQLGASVVLTHVQHGATFGVLDKGATKAQGLALLEPWLQVAKDIGVAAQASLVQGPDVAQAICSVARDEEANLIFMPTHAREGINRVLLGSVAERVTRLSMIPVMLMRLEGQRYPLHFHHIIVPVDGSEPNEIAIRQACALAMNLQARVTLLHIIQDELFYVTALNTTLHNTRSEAIKQSMKQEATNILEKARAIASPYPVEVKMVHSHDQGAAHAINEEVRRMHGDLIVIGTHGLRGVHRLLLSSVAEAVAHHAPVSVMLVSAAQKAELWEPSVLGKLAKEVNEERQKRNAQSAKIEVHT